MLQIANNTNQDSSQTTPPNPAWNGTCPPSYSANNLGHASEPDGSNTDTLPGSYSDQEPSGNGGGEDDGDEIVVGDVDVGSVECSVYPPPVYTLETIEDHERYKSGGSIKKPLLGIRRCD